MGLGLFLRRGSGDGHGEMAGTAMGPMACAVVAALCALGMLLTVTRAIWLGGLLAAVVVVWATLACGA